MRFVDTSDNDIRVSDFDYALPRELIAQHPIQDRAASRLMLLNKHTGERRHVVFRDIVRFFSPGDCLVLNNTRVMPARLLGHSGGYPIEILLLNNTEGSIWEVMVKPGKRARPSAELVFGGGELTARVVDVLETGNRLMAFSYSGIFAEILDRLGDMPLPPYITEKLADRERYQTVYSKHSGSAAAPTAGLHFTETLLDEIRDMGVLTAEITLHVGLGTFRPVKAENASEHHMHSEYFCIKPGQADVINSAKQRGGRVIAVGTTVCRTIESRTLNNTLQAGSGWTDIFIRPGYRFKLTDALITNFHLPKSTLMMLVSALAGREAVLNAYAEAIDQGYRFFSFGDAMFIV